MDPVEQIHFPPSGEFSLSSYMNVDYNHAQLQQRMKLASYSTLEGDLIERVEAMVSTVLLHQEDIWDMLLHLFPDYAAASSDSSADVSSKSASSSPTHHVAVIKRKLENAMDWCRLAQCRLQEHSSLQRRAMASTPGCLRF